MPPAELVERLRHLGHLGRHDVGPDLASLGRHRFGDGTVGVDGVAAVDEEMRIPLTHRLVDLHAAKSRVDAPALPSGVAAPEEPNLAGAAISPAPFVVELMRWHHEAAGHRLADHTRVAQPLERDPDDHIA